MRYYRLDNGGYCKTLFCISDGATEITEEEYNANVPPEDPSEEEAEIADYEQALADLGVRV